MYKKMIIIVFGLTALARPALSENSEEDAYSGDTAVKYVLEQGSVFSVKGNERTLIETEAPALAVHVEGGELYVAMGDYGAAIFDIENPEAPRLLKKIPVFHGRVTGFMRADDRLWMIVDSTVAVLVSGAVPGPGGEEAEVVMIPGQVQPGAGAAARAEEREPEAKLNLKGPIQIAEIRPGRVKLNVGLSSGLKAGDRLAVFRKVPIEQKGAEDFVGKELVAVLTVTAVNEESSLAELAMGDRVFKDDEVEPAEAKHGSSMVFPRRLSNVGEIAAAIRPLVGVGDPKGFGALCDIGVSYWGKVYFLGLQIQPLGFGWTSDGNVVSASFLAQGGFDGRAFAIGMGAGVVAVNGNMDQMLVSSGVSSAGADSGEYVNSEPTWNQRTRVAFALSQHARIGARDGLNLTVANILIWHKDEDADSAGFIYGSTTGRINIPLPARTNLFLEGGGGVMGYGYGAIGAFTWVRGNGDAGSVGLSVSAGGAGIWGNREKIYELDGQAVLDEIGSQQFITERVTLAGPLISFGLTYRFGF
jgi:hypothetical protein